MFKALSVTYVNCNQYKLYIYIFKYINVNLWLEIPLRTEATTATSRYRCNRGRRHEVLNLVSAGSTSLTQVFVQCVPGRRGFLLIFNQLKNEHKKPRTFA